MSGRLLFCGSDDNSVHMWDTLKNQHNGICCFIVIKYKNANFAGTLAGHENRITSLSVAPSGIALTTCSWDQHVRVWAA